jgi:hypothetical protein
LFVSELLWGPENKGQTREPGDSLPQCLGGRQPQEAVVERRRVGHGPIEKFKQQGVQAVKGAMTDGLSSIVW